MDETYLKVQGTWCDLSRAIDHDGNLVDARLSEKRDRDAATRFFRRAIELVGHTPNQVTTDGHASYPRAIRETIGSNILHRMNTYLNHRLEQDHRGIQQRYYPMRGLDALRLQPISVVPLTNYATTSVRVPPWENRSHCQNSDALSSNDLSP